MAAATELSPSQYIQHHLSFFNKPIGDGGFWSLNVDSLSVSIIQDDEFATRWFIIINGQADAVVRFTLDAADVEMLVEALRQVIDDLR